MMTIKVYEVDRTGITTRTVREKEQVVPLAEPAFTSVMEHLQVPALHRHHGGGCLVTSTARTRMEHEYKAWLGHTITCIACRAGAPCATATRLGRAWRQGRA
ncbi:hypothetical protein [Streptomyces sp. NPDC057689]|uniref:hypothetical protein n=1 Tax=Streptomyces sp. NPDC057689 TaxID=3346213 RepID=UPI0036CF9E1B